MTTSITAAPPAAMDNHPASSVGPAVDELLGEFVSAQTARLVALDPALGQLAQAAGQAVLGGGKRLRPTFAYWGWRGAVGPRPSVEAVLPALAALEMLHAFALVHDDVMDDSPLRRGRPTAHVALAAWHRAAGLRGDPARFGRSGAILVGDLCLVWADQLIAAARLPASAIFAARTVYDRIRVQTIAGQFLDVVGADSPAWSLPRAMRVTRLKTAYYTVAGPLHFGAALGRPDAGGEHGGRSPAADLERAYTRYGLAVGEAFQVRDDLLDAYGDPAVTGKPAGTDLTAGRPTVLLETARHLAGEPERVTLDRHLGADAKPGDGPRLAAVVEETGARAHLEEMIRRRVAAARAALDRAPIEPTARAALAELALAATGRIA